MGPLNVPIEIQDRACDAIGSGRHKGEVLGILLRGAPVIVAAELRRIVVEVGSYDGEIIEYLKYRADELDPEGNMA